MQQAVTIVDPALSRHWFDQTTRPLVEQPGHAAVGLRVARRDFPVLVVGMPWKAAGREILLHVQADNYDHLPPRAWWVDGAGAPLPADKVPSGGGFQRPPNPYGEDKGWLCFPGWREYHDHVSHQDNPWLPLQARGGHGLSALLVRLLYSLNAQGVAAP